MLRHCGAHRTTVEPAGFTPGQRPEVSGLDPEAPRDGAKLSRVFLGARSSIASAKAARRAESHAIQSRRFDLPSAAGTFGSSLAGAPGTGGEARAFRQFLTPLDQSPP
jgi:hypothetical protein